MTPAEPVTLIDYSAEGVDLTLVRWFLSLTPAERVEVHQQYADDVLAIRNRHAGR